MKVFSTTKYWRVHRTSRLSHTASDGLLQGTSLPPSYHEIDIAVLDAHGGKWMSSWDEKFKGLGISHLRRKRARIVVFAVGAALKPSLPPGCPFCGLESTGSVAHAFMRPSPSLKPKSNLPLHVLHKIASKKPTAMIVVGGGLTSAQIVDTSIQAGVTRVFHIIRGRMKVKHIDVDLPRVGKYKNYHLATFWSAEDDEERFEIVRNACGGGSITPEYRKILLDHEKKGRVEICTETRIMEPRIKGVPRIDHVVYATGLQVDFKTVPAIQPLLDMNDVRCVGGMPCLTDDMMYNEEIPFFVTGRLASLRLGPGAGNLERARTGAERIAWKVGQLLREWNGIHGDARESSSTGSEEGEDEVDRRKLRLGMENQFGILEMIEDGNE